MAKHKYRLMSASIESDPLTLQLLDSSNNSISEYDAIQQQVAQAPPVQVTLSPLSAVPEPSTFGIAMLGFWFSPDAPIWSISLLRSAGWEVTGKSIQLLRVVPASGPVPFCSLTGAITL